MAFIDLIDAFKALMYVRFDNKTLPKSIKKQDSGNSLRELADLILIAKPTDQNKIITLNQVQTYTINWKIDIVPGTTNVPYIDFFGSYPKFTIALNTAPEIINDNFGAGISRNMNIDGITLDSVDFDLGPFLTDGIIIIS